MTFTEPSDYAVAVATALLLSEQDRQERYSVRSLFSHERTHKHHGRGSQISRRLVRTYKELEGRGLIRRQGLMLVVVNRPGLQKLISAGLSNAGSLRKTLEVLRRATEQRADCTNNPEWVRLDGEAKDALRKLGR